MQDLGSLNGANGYSRPHAMNEAGQVVGESGIASGNTHAFLYSNGVMQDLGSLYGTSGNSVALAINESGQVIGASSTVGANTQAFLYSNGVTQHLGSLNGANGFSFPSAINASGQVVGIAEAPGSSPHQGVAQPFLYSEGQMRDLNDLVSAPPGWVLDGHDPLLNDNQHIVARSSSAGWVLLKPIEPEQATEILIDEVGALVTEGTLSQGQANALTQTLESALEQLEAGNTAAAAGQLQAFVQQVNAQVKAGRLSPAQGAALTGPAEAAIGQLDG
jgi:probable HAF family extracellular repeat protein